MTSEDREQLAEQDTLALFRELLGSQILHRRALDEGERCRQRRLQRFIKEELRRRGAWG